MKIQIELNSEIGLPDFDSLFTDDSKKRYQWLIDCTPVIDRCYFPGGTVAYSLFKASRYCYVYGHYLATIVLGLGYLEKSFYGMFVNEGSEKSLERGLVILNKRALISGLINDETHDIISHTQNLRDSFPPFNKNDDRSFKGRQSSYGGSEVHEDDARKLLDIMMKLLSQNS